MSEPMSTGEIEDVLSSIRRLVTEDLRPGARPDAPSSKLKSGDQKLILTPALRVVPEQVADVAKRSTPPKIFDRAETVAEPEIIAPAASEGPDGDDSIDLMRDSTDDAALAPTMGASAVENDERIPHEDDNANTDIADSFTFSSSRTDWKPEDEASQDVLLPEDWNEAPSVAKPVSKLTGVVSAIGAAVDGENEEWESETGDSSLRHLPWQPPVWDDEPESEAQSDAEDDADLKTGQETAVKPAPVQEEAPEAEDVITDTLETQQDAVTDLIDELPAEDVSEALREAPPETRADVVVDSIVPDESTEMLSEGDSYVDEAVLRDIVRVLIREELSGTLGERITRNVRKLVRAEINRALSSRDFE